MLLPATHGAKGNGFATGPGVTGAGAIGAAVGAGVGAFCSLNSNSILVSCQ